jgi:hypothetical protein
MDTRKTTCRPVHNNVRADTVDRETESGNSERGARGCDNDGEDIHRSKKQIQTLIFIDYETALLDGSASTEFYRHDFRVTSMAVSGRDQDGEIISRFYEGEQEVERALKVIERRNLEVWAHNLQFEYAVTRCRFPNVKLNWAGDTMRLVQIYDHGGQEFLEVEEQKSLDQLIEDAGEEELETEDKKQFYKNKNLGLGLDVSVRRLLPEEFQGHKEEAYTWIRDNVPEARKQKKLGKFLNHLPHDIMKRYNIGDTEATMHLYEFITKEFAAMEYDWTYDHMLFLGSVFDTAEAEIRGVPVDRSTLKENTLAVREEIQQIAIEFREKFKEEIEKIERTRLRQCIWKRGAKKKDGSPGNLPKFKTVKSRYRRLMKEKCEVLPIDRDKRNWWHQQVGFNIGSNQQLAMLFCDQLDMVAKFKTAKGGPSFKSSLLHQWGEGGTILGKRRKRLLVMKQQTNLYFLSEYDGRWHWSFKCVGTASGRQAGGKH